MRQVAMPTSAALLYLLLASAVHAQLNPLNVKGKVVELRPNLIVMQVEGGDTWLVNLDPNRVEDGVRYQGLPDIKLEVNGAETADMLRPGMIVRFEADVERKKTVAGAVSEVTLLGPDKNHTFGLLPSVGGAAAKSSDTERMLIVGQLSAASRGGITVALPENKSIKARLDPAAVVKIASSDYSLARPGDDIELEGGYLKAPRVFAMNVKITRVAKPEKPGRKPATASKKADLAGKKPGVEAAPAEPFGGGDPRDAKPAEPAAPAKIIPGKILKVN